ncbi:MAG: DEAD/DEAH box helicase [Eggerthellaceae bacterium]
MADFSQLNLSDRALEAVSQLGFTHPTPIQEKTIPAATLGSDIIACAQTGSGKTLAFALPLMDALGAPLDGRSGPFLLILTPTRELAEQIEGICRTIAGCLSQRVCCVVGGVDPAEQVRALQAGADVVIGTPGRIIDLHESGRLSLASVGKLVLDEADRMLDMGFLPQVRQIIGACPEKRQTLLFSATIDGKAKKRFERYLDHPCLIDQNPAQLPASTVRQFAIEVDHRCKPQLLKALLEEQPPQQTIVFVRTKRRADSLLDHLLSWGYGAACIHSGKSQAQRRSALDDFAQHKVSIIVATDVLARGIDLKSIGLVVNYDIPLQADDYIHRVGRTGRAGTAGCAFTFICPENDRELSQIEKLLGQHIERYRVQGFASQESDRALARRATKRNAKNDPELAAALREYEAHLKKTERRKQARKERRANPSAEKIGTPQRKKKPISPQGKKPSEKKDHSTKRRKR